MEISELLPIVAAIASFAVAAGLLLGFLNKTLEPRRC